MNRLQREAYVCKRAYELAATGLHIEPITVVATLVNEGYPEAPQILNVGTIRRDLHDICVQKWRARTPRRQSYSVSGQ